MDLAAMQRKLGVMLTIVGVCTLGCVAALFFGIRDDNAVLTGLGFAMLAIGFAAQVWFISAFRKPKP